jgi:hypothetical protein
MSPEIKSRDSCVQVAEEHRFNNGRSSQGFNFKYPQLPNIDLKNVAYENVTNDKQLSIVIAKLKEASVLALRCKTTGSDPHSDKIRLLQICSTQSPVYLLDFFHLSGISQLKPLS